MIAGLEKIGKPARASLGARAPARKVASVDATMAMAMACESSRMHAKAASAASAPLKPYRLSRKTVESAESVMAAMTLPASVPISKPHARRGLAHSTPRNTSAPVAA